MVLNYLQQLALSDPQLHESYQKHFDSSKKGQFYRKLKLEGVYNPFNNPYFYLYGPYENYKTYSRVHECEGVMMYFLRQDDLFTGNIQRIEFNKDNMIVGVFYFMSWINDFQYTDAYDQEGNLLWKLFLEQEELEFGKKMDNVPLDSEQELDLHKLLIDKVYKLQQDENGCINLRIIFSDKSTGLSSYICNMTRNVATMIIDPNKIQ